MATSDIIKSLSYFLPLNAGISYTSEPVIAGQYTSLSITVFGDQDSSVVVSFSPDGVNYDSVVTKNFSAGIKSHESVVILSKWIQIKCTNTSGVNQTVFRVGVYGSVNNSTLNAILEGVGNSLPQVDVANFPLGGFGDLRVANVQTKIAYAFIAGNTSIPKDNNVQCNYADIHSGDITGSSTPSIDFSNRMINLKLNGDLNNVSYIQGKPIRYTPGLSSNFRFTMKFSLSDSDVGVTLQVGVGFVTSSGIRSDFLGFGWTSGAPSTYDNFGISYVVAGSVNFIERLSFNGDKMDGTADLPVLDLTKIQVCEISQTYLGAGPIVFRVMNNAGQWVIVHTLKLPGVLTATSARDPSFGFCMFGNLVAGAVIGSGVDSVASGSCGIQQDGVLSEVEEPNVVLHSAIEKTIAGATETVMYSLENFTLFQGTSVHTPLAINEISCSSDGGKNSFIFIYDNCTLSGSSYALVNGFSSMRKDEAGTVSAYGRLIFEVPLSKNSVNLIQLKNQIDIVPGRSITITALSSGTSDIYVGCTYHVK